MNTHLRNPLKIARGLGSAKDGVGHFLTQRITALALAALAVWFVWFVLSLLHTDYAGARAAVAQPCNAVLLIAFAIAMFWHAQLGLQVVIEDYVHTRWVEVFSQVAVKFACFLGAVASVLAVARVAFGS